MSFFALLLFLLFCTTVPALYIAIRRNWVAPMRGTLIIGGFNVVLGTLFSLAQGNAFLQAIFVGPLLGAVFSLFTGVTASYFKSNEDRERAQQQAFQGMQFGQPTATPNAPKEDEFGENWIK